MQYVCLFICDHILSNNTVLVIYFLDSERREECIDFTMMFVLLYEAPSRISQICTYNVTQDR